jgi:hypothetical protein
MTKNQLTPLDVELEQSADLLAQMPDGMIGRYGSTVGIRYLEGLLRRAAEEVRADEPTCRTVDQFRQPVTTVVGTGATKALRDDEIHSAVKSGGGT